MHHYLDFGKVPVGFQSTNNPTLTVQVLGTTANGYQIINRADVGGKYQGTWQTGQANWGYNTLEKNFCGEQETNYDGTAFNVHHVKDFSPVKPSFSRRTRMRAAYHYPYKTTMQSREYEFWSYHPDLK